MGSGKSTKESFCAEESQKKTVKGELKLLKDKLANFELKINSAKNEIIKLQSSEKKIKELIYDADLELKHLKEIDNTSSVSEMIINTKRSIFDKSQICKKYRYKLDKLKQDIEEKNKELDQKEETLKSLQNSSKTLHLRFSRIKTCKSVDISTLQINLDVIQSKLEDKSDTDIRIPITNKDIINYTLSSIDQLIDFPVRECEKKIEKCDEQSMELEQKITELIIYYEDMKGNIMKEFRKVKEELLKITRKSSIDIIKNQSQKSLKIREQLLKSISECKSRDSIIVTDTLVMNTKEKFTVNYI